ncbi:hypothetical protein DES43_14619 [Aquamicrobium defluvii]|uniref:Uncharacterized protein n=1 Tax=Aquamicrobium defluvii TaxID=69279 RepID=A0A4R6Y1Q0_9HYPH|nr:hypothetical protein DES43_14619 [Aquamicrobium defluvii]
MRRGPHLPSTVTLPLASTASAETMRICLGGQSRQTLHNWHRLYDFPKSVGANSDRFYLVAEVERFCFAHGSSVEWV